MKRRNSLDRVLMRAQLPGEVAPGASLIEIVGNSRVLIENQIGVCSYDRCRIVVKMRDGFACVSGENLELTQMTQNQLVITGMVFGISLTDWR